MKYTSTASSSIRVAVLYGIRVELIDDNSMRYDGERPSPNATRGAEGNWCDPSLRTVYLEPGREVQEYFHEVVHTIVQPPWWNIDNTPEDFMLMQFERALARATLSKKEFNAVVCWQEETQCEITNGGPLRRIKNYDHHKFWRTGLDISRRIGILDTHNRPTFKWPDWKKIQKHKRSLWNYIVEGSDPWKNVTPSR